MRDIFHRIGKAELVIAQHTVKLEAVEKAEADHESRLRKLEYLTAKVVGGAILGSAVGGWILSNLGSCVK